MKSNITVCVTAYFVTSKASSQMVFRWVLSGPHEILRNTQGPFIVCLGVYVCMLILFSSLCTEETGGSEEYE